MKLWSLKEKTILIVDDFPGMRTMLRNMLSPYTPEEIVEASNGEDALNLVSSQQFDVILCDYNLGPGKDGQQVLEEIKERELLPYSSVYIMTTAENTSEMVMGAVEYSPDDYLSKPFTKEVLISRLKKLLKRKSKLKEISIATQQRDYVSAIQLCDDQLNSNPHNMFELLKIKTEIFLKMSDYESAESIVKNILEEREIPWALLYLGQIYFHRDQFDDAMYIFEDMIEDYPNYLFAHDWLARTYNSMGKNKDAQEILSAAAKKSPKAIKRQQKLAEISYLNEDYDTSESTYKRIIRTGKNSYYSTPNDYSGLADVYIKKGMISDALSTISDMSTAFTKSSHDKSMKSLVNVAFLYAKIDSIKKLNNQIDEIINHFNASPGSLLSQDAIALAKICYQQNRMSDGNLLTEHAIRNNHDNQNTLDEITGALESLGLSTEAINSLMESKNEVIEINNRGVELATNGKIAESISLFVEAAAAMPENNVINLNTAQSLIMFMNQSEATAKLVAETKKYLERVNFSGSPSEKYRKLTAAYRQLQESLTS